MFNFIWHIIIKSIESGKSQKSDPKLMEAELLLLSEVEVFARAKELNLPITGDKLKMVDNIIISVFGLAACKNAFARRR